MAEEENKKATNHDGPYHRFFADPRMAAQLLRDCIPAHLLEAYDLDNLQRLNAKYHAEETGEERQGDMTWRIPRRDGRGDAYLALLLEFQSSGERFMALRIMVYAGLLWQQLVKEKRLLPGRRLPPIFPIVLCNDEAPWTAPLSLHELIGLAKDSLLWHWQPQVRYNIIDEHRISEEELVSRDTLPALLFRAERAPDQDLVQAPSRVRRGVARLVRGDDEERGGTV